MIGVDWVSVLFNEPKLLKFDPDGDEPIQDSLVSVLFNEPKLLKLQTTRGFI